MPAHRPGEFRFPRQLPRRVRHPSVNGQLFSPDQFDRYSASLPRPAAWHPVQVRAIKCEQSPRRSAQHVRMGDKSLHQYHGEYGWTWVACFQRHLPLRLPHLHSLLLPPHPRLQARRSRRAPLQAPQRPVKMVKSLHRAPARQHRHNLPSESLIQGVIGMNRCTHSRLSWCYVQRASRHAA